MDDYKARLEAKLASDSVSQTLIRAGCLLSAYELLKLQIVDGVRDEYWTGNVRDDGTRIYDDARYRQEVLARDKNRFKASCAWLVEAGALSPEEVHNLEIVRDHRHEVAHELPKILIDPDFEVRTDVLLAAAACLRTVSVFWGRMTVDMDPQWDDQEVKDEDIWGGPDLLMGQLLDIAGLGPEAIREFLSKV